jgi:hypothetical protein
MRLPVLVDAIGKNAEQRSSDKSIPKQLVQQMQLLFFGEETGDGGDDHDDRNEGPEYYKRPRQPGHGNSEPAFRFQKFAVFRGNDTALQNSDNPGPRIRIFFNVGKDSTADDQHKAGLVFFFPLAPFCFFLRDLCPDFSFTFSKGFNLVYSRHRVGSDHTEKIEGRFVEPQPARAPEAKRGTSAYAETTADRQAGRSVEKERSPFAPPSPEPPAQQWSGLEISQPDNSKTAPELLFRDAARATAYDHRPQDAPEQLRGTSAEIWLAFHRSDNVKAFAAALDDKGIAHAVVTKDEDERSRTDAAEAKEKGSYAPIYREHEIVAIDDRAFVYRLNERTTGSSFGNLQSHLRMLDRSTWQGIDGTRQMMHDRAAEYDAAAKVFAALNPVTRPEKAPKVGSVTKDAVRLGLAATRGVKSGISKGLGLAGGAAGMVNVVADALSSLFAPSSPPTPAQIDENERLAHVAGKDAAAAHDWREYTDRYEQVAAKQEEQARLKDIERQQYERLRDTGRERERDR